MFWVPLYGGKCWERDKEANNKIWKKWKNGQGVTL